MTKLSERNRLINELKNLTLKGNQAQSAIDQLYFQAPVMSKPFGDLVEELLKKQGITKMRKGQETIDVKRACELTGLHKGVFYTNMYKKECVVDMGTVVSICIGLKLGPTLSKSLLDSAGLSFRYENPHHLAYIFLLENCMDKTVWECNEILEAAGYPERIWLGSRVRNREGDTGLEN